MISFPGPIGCRVGVSKRGVVIEKVFKEDIVHCSPISPRFLSTCPHHPPYVVCFFPSARICDSSSWSGQRAPSAALSIGARAKRAWDFKSLLLPLQWFLINESAAWKWGPSSLAWTGIGMTYQLELPLGVRLALPFMKLALKRYSLAWFLLLCLFLLLQNCVFLEALPW